LLPLIPKVVWMDVLEPKNALEQIVLYAGYLQASLGLAS
jgi:hypothetical protein